MESCNPENTPGIKDSFIIEQFNQTEEKLLFEVLNKLLNRAPTFEDFKKLTRFQEPGMINSYYLAYDNRKLGTVTLKFPDTNPFHGAYEFVPFTDQELLEIASDGQRVFFKIPPSIGN